MKEEWPAFALLIPEGGKRNNYPASKGRTARVRMTIRDRRWPALATLRLPIPEGGRRMADNKLMLDGIADIGMVEDKDGRWPSLALPATEGGGRE